MGDTAAMRRAAVSLLGSLLAACGARSGLAVDAGRAGDPDVAAQDAADVASTDACASGSFTLRRATPRSVLLVDRSGSMALNLQGSNGIPRRWDVLRALLPMALRGFDADVELGAMLFPAGGTFECGAPVRLDVPFARGNTGAIARALDAAEPTGRTPTFAALVQAERILVGMPGDGPRSVVLATDGGPNCNGALDGDRCVCASSSMSVGQDECRMDPSLCLDDARAVAQVQAMAARALPTFVVGIDGDRRPELVDVLNRMARAGGRPNPLSPTRAYYSVQRAEDLSAAVESIARTIASCTLTAPYRPRDGARVDVRVGAVTVARDASRVEGWDWNAPGSAELVLFGAACDAAARGAAVTVDVRCDAP